MEMVDGSEVRFGQFLGIEQAGQDRRFVHLISGSDLDVHDVDVHGIEDASVRQGMLDGDGQVGEFAENEMDPALADGIDLAFKRPVDVDSGVQVAWDMAFPVFPV